MCSSSVRVQRMPISSSYGSSSLYSSRYGGSSYYSSTRPLPPGGNGPYDEYGHKLKFDSYTTASSFKPRTSSNLTGMGRLTPNKADYDRGIGSHYSGLDYPYATSSTSRYGSTSTSYTSPSKKTEYRSPGTTSSRYGSNITGTVARRSSPTEPPRTPSGLSQRQRSSSLFDLSGTSSSSSHSSSSKRSSFENGFQATTSGADRRRSSVVNDDLDRLSRTLNRASVSDRRRSESTSGSGGGTLPRLRSKENSFDRISSSSRRSSFDKTERESSHGSDSSFLAVNGSKYNDGGKIGLSNLGNTCFMNSVLQCLSNTKPLLLYCLDEEYDQQINRRTSSMRGQLIKAFSKLLRSLWKDSNDMFVTPNSFKTEVQRFAPRFMGYQQQDSQEFLRYLLEGLHEDVNQVQEKPKPVTLEDEKLENKSDEEKAALYWKTYLRFDNSKIVDIFVGQLKSELKFECGHTSVTFDPFWDLSLPLPKRTGQTHIEDCLKLFMRKEKLESDERPTCYKCKQRKPCSKGFSIQKFPQILVLHLKRFSQERFSRKVTTTVEFPIKDLDLTEFAADSRRGPVLYNLYAVSNHCGGTHSGHYTAICRHPFREEWNLFNDTRVSKSRPNHAVSSEAYLLFYELNKPSSNLNSF
ncbi:ubiquitin carboxyl-terminal hydrolase 2-like isoform X2 [Gigantopelta aegis]|uniref:ubiquitin carboxyl-terminal hydrolase 2-like isoform X2 n=1 Tax=Gigantopelta aegis TaxID=1735272 RepID=UPI001B88A9C1|nr:ubiquitin carboxyl-terminal hydrolase 2-like isoform X2 [Gigantopelta aegis]